MPTDAGVIIAGAVGVIGILAESIVVSLATNRRHQFVSQVNRALAIDPPDLRHAEERSTPHGVVSGIAASAVCCSALCSSLAKVPHTAEVNWLEYRASADHWWIPSAAHCTPANFFLFICVIGTLVWLDQRVFGACMPLRAIPENVDPAKQSDRQKVYFRALAMKVLGHGVLSAIALVYIYLMFTIQ